MVYIILLFSLFLFFILYNIIIIIFIVNRDFIARHTLRVEFGLANEMDQLDRNFKLRQVMGLPTPNSNSTQANSPFKQSIRGFT